MRFSIGSVAPRCQAASAAAATGTAAAKRLTRAGGASEYARGMRWRRWMRGLAGLVVAAALVACATTSEFAPDPAPDPVPGSAPEPPQLPGELPALLTLVNEARAEARTCGSTLYAATHPLTLEPRLTAAAQAHSVDMHTNGFMSHTGSDGSGPSDRVEREGYDWRRLSENVAWGYGSAASVMGGWLGSAGHCRNIMDPNVTELGLGLSGSSWTQVFARPW